MIAPEVVFSIREYYSQVKAAEEDSCQQKSKKRRGSLPYRSPPSSCQPSENRVESKIRLQSGRGSLLSFTPSKKNDTDSDWWSGTSLGSNDAGEVLPIG